MPDMLIVRRAQLASFEDAGRAAFVEAAVRQLRDEQPADFDRLGEDGARAMAERAVQTGHRHGLSARHDVMGLLLMMIALGPHFDTEFNWAQDVLSNPWLAADGKLPLLIERWGELSSREAAAAEASLAALDMAAAAAEQRATEEALDGVDIGW